MSKKNGLSKYQSVLLIDDNDLDNFINQKVIESVNFAKDIYINTSGTSGLEFLRNITAVSCEGKSLFPEVIFVDINMPIMDGFQFINDMNKQFNEKLTQTKIVILTTSLNPADKVTAEKISKDIVFLFKPLTEAALGSI